MIVNIGEYVEIDENYLFCKICEGALKIDDHSWSYVCPNNHSYHQDSRAEWSREKDKVPSKISTYEFIRECWINDWDLDSSELHEILKENYDKVRKAHEIISEAETEEFLKEHDIQID